MAKVSTFPLDAWYAVGWRQDVGKALKAITVCDIPMVVYRRSDGAVSVLEDACRHRLLPLSMGRLENDQVVCGYHGMTFDAHGKCVKLPGRSNGRPAASGGVRSFPVVEQHNLIWVWPGDAAKSELNPVPDLHWADDPDWRSAGSCLQMNCNYLLVLDNLLDLTHEAFVHASSIGNQHIVDAPFDVSTQGRFVEVTRWMIDVVAPPFLATQLERAHGLPAAGVDRWQMIRFEAPSVVVIDVGVAQTGSGAHQGNRSKGISGRVLNAVTPATADSCHYFFTYARDFALDDEELTIDLKSRNIAIFTEDKAILEAQQHSMQRLPARRLLDIDIDRGSMHARRAINVMIQSENASASSA